MTENGVAVGIVTDDLRALDGSRNDIAIGVMLVTGGMIERAKRRHAGNGYLRIIGETEGGANICFGKTSDAS